MQKHYCLTQSSTNISITQQAAAVIIPLPAMMNGMKGNKNDLLWIQNRCGSSRRLDLYSQSWRQNCWVQMSFFSETGYSSVLKRQSSSVASPEWEGWVNAWDMMFYVQWAQRHHPFLLWVLIQAESPPKALQESFFLPRLDFLCNTCGGYIIQLWRSRSSGTVTWSENRKGLVRLSLVIVSSD